MEISLQDQYAPHLMCFGCGPQNEKGLQLKSFVRDEFLVANWQGQPHHQAYEGMLNGGVIGSLLDCHCNWAASWNLRIANEAERMPVCVTAEYTIKLHAPTPLDQPLTL